MIKTETQKLSAYKGDYRPVQVYKNGVNTDGYKIAGMQGNEGSFEGTYNDYLTLYGKCGYKNAKNLCPTPNSTAGSHEDEGVEYSWSLTKNTDGTFNFSGAMAMGSGVATVTLPAGTYTASGCELIQLWWEEKGEFQTLPTTFTLDNESEIACVLWYTDTPKLSLENQYIQIEAGETATEFSPYCGDASKTPAPDNIRPIIGARGTIFTNGKNLLDISSILGSSVSANGGTLICGRDGGITGSGTPTSGVSFLGLPRLYLPSGIYTLSRSGTFTNMSCAMYLFDADGNRLMSFGVTDAGNATKYTFNIADYPTFSYATFELKRSNNNVEMSGTAYFQLEAGATATGYHPSFGEHTVSAPELFGIEVDANDPYNYTEMVDGVTKYYIADSFCSNVLTKRIGAIDLNGSEDWFIFEDNAHEREFVLDMRATKHAASINKSGIPCICNTFEGLSREKIWNKQLGISNTSSYIRVSQGYDDVFGADVNAFKSFLKEQHAAGTPVTVYYVLAEPCSLTYYSTDSQTGETKPLTTKAFPRFTDVTVAPDENHLCYGMAECIKIAK